MEHGFFSGIEDYLKRLGSSLFGTRNPNSDRRTALSPSKKFEGILSSCRIARGKMEKNKSTGLKISDYLANPVHVKFPGTINNSSPSRKVKTIHLDQSFGTYRSSRYTVPFKNITPATTYQTEGSQSIHNPDKNSLSEPVNISIHQKIEQSIKKASSKYGIEPNLIRAIVKTESNFRVRAVSPAGAQGLMQLMPKTAKYLGVKNPFDIDQNIEGGTLYLRKMLDLFGDDVQLALAAYNAGPGSVRHHKGIPPYRETASFVDRVLRLSEQMA